MTRNRSLGPYRVWVVEDDPVQRKVFADVVRSRGHAVLEFGDAESALEAYRVDPPHMILLDWLFPGLDGIELCKRIRKLPGGTNTVIVMVTIRNQSRDLTIVLDAGADDYIPKPVDAALVQTRVTIAERMVADRIMATTSEGRYHSVIAAMAEGVVVLDRGGHIQDSNTAAEMILGSDKERLVGRLLFEADYSPVKEDGSSWRADNLPQYRTIEDSTPACDEIVGISTDGVHLTWLSVNVQSLGSPEGHSDEGVVVSLNDVTARINAAKDREQIAARVQYSQKLESLGVLAGGIAHDFNNLLVGILGNASLALMELPDDSSARSLIEQIETTSMRAADLTNQMLAYSGRGKFVIQAVRLDKLVEEMAQLLSSAISKKAMMEYDFEDQLPAVQGDVSQLRQVVMNLITNASDALGDERGVIRLRTGTAEVEKNQILDATAQEPLAPGIYVYMEVADSGDGMAEDTLARVFDPFFTTKFTGRGLGLAAVLGIVRGHHGAIKVWSRPGQGSSFKVYLPCEATASSDRKLSPAVAGDASQFVQASTVLVVDDEQTVRQVTRSMLERFGYSVIEATDGGEAVRLYREHRDDIVSILLDLTMPVMSGEEAYRKIMEIDHDARVLVMSGFNESDAVERFGGVDVQFIQKPFKPDILRDKMELLTGEGAPGRV